MSAKKLLGIKIAAVAAGVLLVPVALKVHHDWYWHKPHDPPAVGHLVAQHEPDLPPERRHVMEYIHAADACPGAPVALRQGKPYNPFGLRPDARGWPSDQGSYVVFLQWRDRLSPAARAEYVRRCLAGAAEEWLRSEQYGGGTLPHTSMGYLFVAYNASDSACQREEIARQFYNRRLIYRGNWVRNNGPARGTIKADEFVLLDWDLLQAGRGEAAAVPDPLLAFQPGTR